MLLCTVLVYCAGLQAGGCGVVSVCASDQVGHHPMHLLRRFALCCCTVLPLPEGGRRAVLVCTSDEEGHRPVPFHYYCY
jgi:hypothetical protein